MFIPPQASTAAGPIDLIILAVSIVAAVFSVGIVVAVVYLVVVYRRGRKVDRSNPPLENLPIEIAWTVIPLLIAMGLFVWSTAIFLDFKRIPKGAIEIFVTGKQWMWKMQHPEGRWENNELHLPSGRPVQLTMTSEDVIHSFFVPAFRIHQDVVPGEYTYMWFTPTRPGTYPLYCAQFCGTQHSEMVGTVTVMEPAAYQEWLAGGTATQSLAEAGKGLFIKHGCAGCHAGGGSVRAPRLEGIFGKPVAVQLPAEGLDQKRLEQVLKTLPATTTIADQRYIHDSVVLPNKEVAAGYLPVMPTFKNRLKEEEILKLVAYIRSLANVSPEGMGPAQVPRNRNLSPEEYEARTGFKPPSTPGRPNPAANAGQ
jgi:cytochrome c oxidase subunit 2